MRFGSTAKVLLKCKLKYYRISVCHAVTAFYGPQYHFQRMVQTIRCRRHLCPLHSLFFCFPGFKLQEQTCHRVVQDFQEESLDPDDLIPETRDVEAEDELIEGVSRDPLAAYDVHVSEEGQAIQEYLDKIASMPGICDA